MQERTLSRAGSCGDTLKSLFREKQFLPGLLAENKDGNGSLPRSRNLISEKVSTRPSTLYGRGRADIHHGPESMTPLKAEYIGADQLPFFVFRLQLCGGPYIPISPVYQDLGAFAGDLLGSGGASFFRLTPNKLDSSRTFSGPQVSRFQRGSS